jgi:hypothetical protein
MKKTWPPSPITGPSRRRSIKPFLVAPAANPRDQVADGLETLFTIGNTERIMLAIVFWF